MSHPANPQQPGTPSSPGGGPDGQLQLTTRRVLAAAALAGAVVGYFIVGTMEWRGMSVPVTPWSLPLMLLALGTGGLVYARTLRRQVAEARATVRTEAAMMALVLGKTMLMTGAIMAGGHLVYLLANLDQLDAPLPRERVLRGATTLLCSLVLGAGGWALERACLVPPGGDDQGSDDQGSDDQGSDDQQSLAG